MKYKLYCEVLERSFNYTIYQKNLKDKLDNFIFSATLTEKNTTPIDSLKDARGLYLLWQKKRHREKFKIQQYDFIHNNDNSSI